MGFLKATDVLSGKIDLLQAKLCGCGCGERLDPRVDGERPRIGGKEVREDCYYSSFGNELEKHPIGGRGICRK